MQYYLYVVNAIEAFVTLKDLLENQSNFRSSTSDAVTDVPICLETKQPNIWNDFAEQEFI